jgi:hypothetical protein
MKPIGPSPEFPVVHKDGSITHIHYAQNAGGSWIEIFNGRAVLNAAGRQRGLVSLEDCFSDDPRDVIKADGWKTYRAWMKAIKLGKAPREPVPGPVPGSIGYRFKDFPDKWLPQEVLKRRAGTSDVSTTDWEAPEVDIPALDESGEVKPEKKTKAPKSV